MLVPLTEGWKLLRHDPNSMLFITTLQKLKAISHWESPSKSLTLGEERRLRALGNRVLRRIFGSKRDKVAGEWGKLHNEELNDLYCSPNIVRAIK